MRLFRLRLDQGPSDVFGRATLGLGFASLLPLVGPLMVVLAAAAGITGTFLSTRNPARWSGRQKIYAGLGICLLGMALFFTEGALFLRWKVRQVYDQRMAVSRLRLNEIAQALERYREAHGSYPQVSGIMNLSALLQPRYLPDCPVLDAFDQAISVDCRPAGFILRFTPPPPKGGTEAPPAVEVHGTFQPAPSPQVLPPDFIGPAAPPGLSAAIPEALPAKVPEANAPPPVPPTEAPRGALSAEPVR